MNLPLYIIAISTVILVGCGPQRPAVPMAIAGSKADATVVMGFEQGAFSSGQVDWDSAHNTASARCLRWGYQTAEAFDGIKKQCNFRNQYGCMRWHISRTYQCA